MLNKVGNQLTTPFQPKFYRLASYPTSGLSVLGQCFLPLFSWALACKKLFMTEQKKKKRENEWVINLGLHPLMFVLKIMLKNRGKHKYFN